MEHQLTLYTVGDANFLYNVINSVVAADNDGSWNLAVGAAALLLAATVVFKYVLDGGRPIGVHTLAVSAIIYGGCFGITVPLTIQNPNTGETYNVDNVPFGPAFAGALVSQMGYNLTNAMQSSFSTPSGTQTGWAGGIEALRIARIETTRDGKLNANGLSPASSQLIHAWADYIGQCMQKTTTGGAAYIELYQNVDMSSLGNGFTFNSTMGSLNFAEVAPAIANLAQYSTCGAGVYNTLMQDTDDLINNGLAPGVLAPALGISTSAPGGPGPAALNELTSALSAIGITASPVNFLEASIIDTAFNQGAKNVARDLWLDYPLAKSIEDTINQRNDAWNAEGFLFGNMVMSMASILECLLYGSLPIIAVMMVSGPSGWGAGMKWMQAAIWLQLWSPLFSIINFYIALTSQNFINSLNQNVQQFSLLWFEGFMDQHLQSQYALADHAAALVPVLAGMLAWGGQKGLSSIAENYGQSNYDPKKTAPDQIGAAPLIVPESQQATQAVGLGYRSIAQHQQLVGTGETITDTSKKEAATSHARELSAAAAVQFSKTLQRADSSSDTNTRAEAAQIREALTQTHQYQENLQAISSWGKSHNIGSDEEYKKAAEQATLSQLAGKMGLGFSIGGNGATLSTSKAYESRNAESKSNTNSVTDADIKKLENSLNAGFTTSEQRSQEIAKQISQQIQHQESVTDSTSNGEDDSFRQSDTAKLANSVSFAWSSANTIQTTFTRDGYSELTKYADAVARSGSTSTDYNNLMANNPTLNGSYRRWAEQNQNIVNGVGDKRAQFEFLREASLGLTPAVRDERDQKLAKAFFDRNDAKVLGFSTAGGANSAEGRDAESKAESSGLTLPSATDIDRVGAVAAAAGRVVRGASVNVPKVQQNQGLNSAKAISPTIPNTNHLPAKGSTSPPPVSLPALAAEPAAPVKSGATKPTPIEPAAPTLQQQSGWVVNWRQSVASKTLDKYDTGQYPFKVPPPIGSDGANDSASDPVSVLEGSSGKEAQSPAPLTKESRPVEGNEAPVGANLPGASLAGQR